jgi:hypothetical protein
MENTLNYNINVGGNANESVGSLKKQLREAQAEVGALSDKFGATSKEAIEAAKRAGELKDRIGDAKALTEAFNPDAKFKSLTASLSGVAGGFAAVQGAIGLFGGESKELEKQLLKVQSALALSQGLQSVGESIDSFKQLGAVIQTTTLFLKANAAANALTAATLRAVGVAAETTAIGFKVLKAAIVSTGIGVLVIALGELLSALMNYTSAADKAAKKQKELNEEIVKGTEAGNKAVKEYLKSSAELEELRAKLAGKGEDEILAIRKKSLNSQIEQNKKDYEQLIKLDKVKASALIDENANLTNELTKLDINFKIDQKKRQEEADKKAIENNKKKTDEQKRLDQEEQQRIKERNDRESAAQQIQIDAFRSTLDKRQQDILAAEDDFEKKKGELIKAGVTDFTLVEEQYRLKLLEINKTYDLQELEQKKKVQDVNKQRELELAQLNAVTLEEKRELDLLNLETEYNDKLLLAITNGENVIALEELIAAKKKAINQKFIEDKKAQDEEIKKADQQLVDAKFAIASAGLNLLGSLAGQNEKIANAIFALDKALAVAKIVVDTQREISAYGANPVWSLSPDGGALIKSKYILGAKLRAAASIATIAGTTIAKFKGGTTSANFGQGGAINTSGTPIIPTQQTQLTQLNQQSINAIGNSAIRAYVVETDITSNQKRVQAIKQRARFS